MNLDLGSLVWTQLLWAQLWQVTLLGLVVWGAVRWLAADRPHLAHALGLLVLIKCLTPPVLASPTSPFSWLQARNHSNSTSPSGAKTSDFRAADSSRFANGSNLVIRTNLFQVDKDNKTDSGAVPSTAIDNEPDKTRSQFFRTRSASWPIVFAVLWLGGAAINLIVTSIRFLLFWRSTCLRPAVAQPQLEQSVSTWSRELGLRQHIRIRVLDSPIGPAVVGLFRPLILLPLVLVEGRSEKDLKPLLAHELIHIRRGDLFWAMIQTLAGCLFWFHPLVRWGVRMVTQESERSCDEETVANLGCSPATYARCLLDVLELKQSLRVAPAVPGIRPVDITSNRMERIMKLGQGCQKRTPLWVWLVMLVSGSIVLPGAALVFGQEEEPSSSGRRLPILESQAAASNENGTDPMRVEPYDVADLLKQADQFGDQNFKPSVKLLWAVSNGNRNSKHSLKATLKHTDSDGNVEEIVLGDSEPNLKVAGTRLYVYGTEGDQQHVKHRLNHLREMGFRQIVVEVFMVTLDEADLQELGIEWRQSAGKGIAASVQAVETVGAITTMPEVKFDPSTLVDANFKQAAYEISLEASNEPQQLSNEIVNGIMGGSFPNIDQVCGLHSELNGESKQVNALQRSHEMQYAIASNDEVERLLFGRVKSNSTASLTQMPTVTIFSGQTASIVNGSCRPFVIGLKNLSPGINQPKIGLVCDGMSTTLSAELQSNGSIRLSNKLVLSTIEDAARTFNLQDKPWGTERILKADPDLAVKVQVPIVSFIGFRSDVVIPQDQALILNTSLSEARTNNQIPSLVVIRCRALESKPVIYSAPVLNEHLPMTIGDWEAKVYRPDNSKSQEPEREPTALDHDPTTKNMKAEIGLPIVGREKCFRNVGVVPESYLLTDDIQYRNRTMHKDPSPSDPFKQLASHVPYIQRLLRNTGKSSLELENPHGVDTIENKSSEQPEASFQKIVIRSLDESKNDTSERLILKLNDGVELQLETDVERKKTEDGLIIRGQRLIVEYQGFTLRCEQGELELTKAGGFRFSGQAVKAKTNEMQADFVEITKQPTEQLMLELRGNSSITIEDRKFKADKIKIFEEDGMIDMEGAASISKVFASLDAQGLLRKEGEALTVGKKLVFGVEKDAALVIEP